MHIMITILDCYTDEPAGLGVPPYLGTYPRYIAGSLQDVNYITIDDLRFLKYYNLGKKKKLSKNEKGLEKAKLFQKEISHKTNIKIYNLTKNISNIKELLDNTTRLIIILGVHTPGKYLSAIPGTLKEVTALIKDLDCEKILTGPAIFGTQSEGGKFFEQTNLDIFDRTDKFDFNYNEIKDIFQVIYSTLEFIFTFHAGNHFNFCTGKLNGRRYNKEVFIISSNYCISGVCIVYYHIINGYLYFILIDTKATC